jgi:hypothetical protein
VAGLPFRAAPPEQLRRADLLVEVRSGASLRSSILCPFATEFLDVIGGAARTIFGIGFAAHGSDLLRHIRSRKSLGARGQCQDRAGNPRILGLWRSIPPTLICPTCAGWERFSRVSSLTKQASTQPTAFKNHSRMPRRRRTISGKHSKERIRPVRVEAG